jgi:hypothetical protein
LTIHKRSRPYVLRRICETMDKPFDAQDVFLQQQGMTRDEVEKALAAADYLHEVTASGHNRRAIYEFRQECRDRHVTTAVARRTCADCGATINPGEMIYDPRPRARDNTRSKALCRECGLRLLAAHMVLLVGVPVTQPK